MLSTPLTTLLVLAANVDLYSASGLAPRASRSRCSRSSATSSSLNVGVSLDDTNAKPADDRHAMIASHPQLFKRASDCAKDEECSVEEWESALAEMEYASAMDSSDLASLVMEGVQHGHQLEERAALSHWTSPRNLPLVVVMFLASTYSTVTAPYDEIVIRIGWLFQDWTQVATQSTSSQQQHLPLFMCVAAAYVAVSEVVSCFVPAVKARNTL